MAEVMAEVDGSAIPKAIRKPHVSAAVRPAHAVPAVTRTMRTMIVHTPAKAGAVVAAAVAAVPVVIHATMKITALLPAPVRAAAARVKAGTATPKVIPKQHAAAGKTDSFLAKETPRFSGCFSLENWCCRSGLNARPLPYQGSALPLSYGS
jgi:hypothetical protein